MHLLSIRASFFRGFGDVPGITLDSPLVIFFGTNGSGKTSIAEALEWLLFGTTSRGLGDNVDEVEQRGALRSTLCPDGVDPFVEVQVRLRDNSDHSLRRILHSDGASEVTTLYLDGQKVPDFASVGLVNSECFNPLILQHNLQELVLSSGVQRRQFISRLLGLGPALAYDRAVDAAIARFVTSLPDDIALAWSAFQNLKTGIANWQIPESVRERWMADQIAYPDDWHTVLEYCRAELQIPGASADTVREHAARRAEDARRAVFDIFPFRPRQDLPKLIASYEQQISAVETAFEHLCQSVGNYVSAKMQIYDQIQFALVPERLEFWRTGLGLLDVSAIPLDEAIHCPFCEELTITRDKVQILEGRLDRTERCTRTRTHMQELVEDCCTQLDQLVTTAGPLVPELLDETSRNCLASLLPDKLHDIALFADSLSAIHTSFSALQTDIQSAKTALDNLLPIVDDPAQAHKLRAFLKDSPVVLRQAAQTLHAGVDHHLSGFQAFWALLQPALASDETVRHFELVGYLATTRHSILVASEVCRVHNELRSARQTTRDFLSREDRVRIQQRGEEIGDWFQILYGAHENIVEFEAIDPRGTTMRLFANILGQTRHASTHLSQSQLNCLGLAMHIVAATANDCPFDFVLFDDPIQSLDDELRENFLGSALSRLLENHGKQIIVLTHIRNLADRLRYGNERREPLYYQFSSFAERAIRVRATNQLQVNSQYIRKRARGDDLERSVACQRLRTFVEHVTKAIYQAQTTHALPAEYENRTGADLIVLLESISGFPSPDLDHMRESVLFGVPASHDDPEWHPPLTQAIARQMDRLEQIVRNHGLTI